MDNHSFCRMLLKQAREDAERTGVTVPKGLTALALLDGKQYWIEAKGMKGVYEKGCCAYEAKANFISRLIDKE